LDFLEFYLDAQFWEVLFVGNIQTVKKISKEKGISLAFVCRQIGRSHGYLAEIANRDGDVPEKMLGPIANALGVTVEELKGEDPAQKEKPNALDGIELEKLSPARRALLEALDGMDDENIMKIVRIAQAVKKEFPE
jgi:transcriptional regulator with XRE-family HTH domain